MKEEDKKIKAGKPYDELTKEEKALIVDFTEEEHAGMKLKYGKRLKHVTVQVDEDERYDYLIVRPNKNILLAMVLAIGRAMGETMAVMMVMGNANLFPRLLGKGESIAAVIALEMGTAVVGSPHYHALYAAGLVLMVLL